MIADPHRRSNHSWFVCLMVRFVEGSSYRLTFCWTAGVRLEIEVDESPLGMNDSWKACNKAEFQLGNPLLSCGHSFFSERCATSWPTDWWSEYNWGKAHAESWEFTINLNMVKLAWLKPGLFSSKRRMREPYKTVEGGVYYSLLYV